jgi:hypothetical protein
MADLSRTYCDAFDVVIPDLLQISKRSKEVLFLKLFYA